MHDEGSLFDFQENIEEDLAVGTQVLTSLRYYIFLSMLLLPV